MQRHNDLKLPIILGLILAVLLIPKIAVTMLLVSGFILFSPLILIFLIFLFIFFKGNKPFVFRKKVNSDTNYRDNNSKDPETEHFPQKEKDKHERRTHNTITLSEEDYKVVNKEAPRE